MAFKESKDHLAYIAITTSAIGVSATIVWLGIQLIEWKKQGHDYMGLVLNLVVTLTTVILNLTAAFLHWKAVRRARVHAVTLRDDYKTRTETQSKLHGKALNDAKAVLREQCDKEKAAIETKWTIKSSSAYGMLEQQYDEQIRHLQEQHEAEIEQLKNHYFNERDRRI